MSLSISTQDTSRIAPMPSLSEVAPASAPLPKARVAVTDTFFAAAAPAPLPLNGQPDSAYDGKRLGAGGKAYDPSAGPDAVPGFTPADGSTPKETIVYIIDQA